MVKSTELPTTANLDVVRRGNKFYRYLRLCPTTREPTSERYISTRNIYPWCDMSNNIKRKPETNLTNLIAITVDRLLVFSIRNCSPAEHGFSHL